LRWFAPGSQAESGGGNGVMSEFIIDLTLPGNHQCVPIADLAGGEHFNEAFFDNTFD